MDVSKGLDKEMISTLSMGEYISKGESVLITGTTRCSKSFIASALGHHAYVQGYKVTYYNVQKLLLKTKMARSEGAIYKLFEKISKPNLLILDDFRLTHLERQQQLDMTEMIEDKHRKTSTIITSLLPVASWVDIIDEATITDAILDRSGYTS